MNLSLPLGFILGIGVISWAILSETANPGIYASIHGIAIVSGGTAAAAFISLNFDQIRMLFVVFLRAFTGRGKKEIIQTINDIVSLSSIIETGGDLTAAIKKAKNPFLRESLELYVSESLSDQELYEVLRKRVELQNEKYRRDGSAFKIVGKFPPAFGLVGATMGMIALLQGLGSPDSFSKIGPSMSVALTATFYGLSLANLVLVPLGENLAQASMDDLVHRRLVVDGVRLLKEGKHPLIVEEFLKSYLAPSDRNRIKKK